MYDWLKDSRVDDIGLRRGAVVVVALVALGGWWLSGSVERSAERALRAVARVPESVKIESSRRNGRYLCGTWSAKNAFGQRLPPTRFFAYGDATHVDVEPESDIDAQAVLRFDTNYRLNCDTPPGE